MLVTLIEACSSECQLPVKIFFAAPDLELRLIARLHNNDRHFLLGQCDPEVTIETVGHRMYEDRGTGLELG
jgi:hypothetical protein